MDSGFGDLSNFSWGWGNYPQPGTDPRTDLDEHDNQQNPFPEANEHVKMGTNLQLSSDSNHEVSHGARNHVTASRPPPALGLFDPFEHGWTTDFDSKLPSDQNQRPEHVEDCHSARHSFKLSSASQENNNLLLQDCSSKAMFLWSRKHQPAAGGGSIMEHNQTNSPTLPPASVAPSENYFDGCLIRTREQRGEKEKNESYKKEQRRMCQKRSRDKKKQEAVEMKENLEKARKENDDLRRTVAEHDKTIETKDEKINELAKENSKLRDDYEKLQENAKGLEEKNENLEGKNLKLKDRLRQKTGKIGKSNKPTTSWTKFPIENSVFKIKKGSYYLKLINDDDISC